VQEIRYVDGDVFNQSAKPASLAKVPRHVAAAINPLISEQNPNTTIEAVADLIEDLGIAAYENDPGSDGATNKRLHQQMSCLLATALRYEVAQAANDAACDPRSI
jgi:hypothetical protein